MIPIKLLMHINSPKEEVFEDEQSLINGYFTQVNVPGLGERTTVGNLVKMSETPGSEKGDPPSLGEANTDVLKSVGLDEKEIEEINAVAESTREEAFQTLAQLRDS